MRCRWAHVRYIERDEAVTLVGAVPSNKCGKVFAAGDRHVDAVYAHDRRLSIIRTSHYNLIPDIGCGVRMHDDFDNVHRHDDLLAGDSAAMWACDKKDRAARLTSDAAKVLSRQGYQATVVEPLPCVPRFHGPASIAPKVFVPCLQGTTPEGTFTGKVVFNRFGEAIALWTGDRLV